MALSGLCGSETYQVTPETLARFPDVLTVTKADEDLETVSEDLCTVLDEALKAYNTMRAVEGEKLAEDIASRLDTIDECTGRVEARSSRDGCGVSGQTDCPHAGGAAKHHHRPPAHPH